MKLSIIIPIYNRENTLRRCLQSISKMHYYDYEVLMVDDGSTDKSAEVCKEYANEDERFQYYYKVNGGVSSARNLGISKAKGEWITFVDSDDYVLSDHLSLLHEDMMTDFITTGIQVLEVGNTPIIRGSQTISSIVGLRNICDKFFSAHLYINNPVYLVTNKCFKLSIIKNYGIKFCTDVSLGEDQIFIDHYLEHINSWKYNSIASYCMCASSFDGLSSKNRPISDHWHCMFEVFKSLYTISIKSKSFVTFRYSCVYFVTRLWRRVIKNSIKDVIYYKNR